MKRSLKDIFPAEMNVQSALRVKHMLYRADTFVGPAKRRPRIKFPEVKRSFIADAGSSHPAGRTGLLMLTFSALKVGRFPRLTGVRS